MIQFVKQQLKTAWLAYMTGADRRRRAALGLEDGHLPPECWRASVNEQGHLVLGGADTVALARQFGTPLYVVDAEALRDTYESFVGAFRAHYPLVEVDYSYKTNPLPGVLEALHAAGAGAEVISPFELWLALSLGVDPGRITFNGPAKTTDGLETAVSRGIRLINVDNLDEVDTLQELAARHDRVQRVGVRVTTSVGWSSQFGLSIRSGAARAAFERAHAAANLDACSLHIHLGTGIKDPQMYGQAVREVLQFAASLRDDLGARFRYFDFGGGFGVPTVRNYTASDQRLVANGRPAMIVDTSEAPRIESYARLIGELLGECWPVAEADRPTILFEPGRAITSSAQSLLLSVLAVKPADAGHHNIILDGGLNVAQPTCFEIHEALPASRMNAPRTIDANLCGPLCHPSDVLGWQRRMPQFAAGDVVAIMDAGAYFIPNQMHFSNPKAAGVMVENGEPRLIRGRESFAEVVRFDGIADPAPASTVAGAASAAIGASAEAVAEASPVHAAAGAFDRDGG